jgi:hypothetical protein
MAKYWSFRFKHLIAQTSLMPTIVASVKNVQSNLIYRCQVGTAEVSIHVTWVQSQWPPLSLVSVRHVICSVLS